MGLRVTVVRLGILALWGVAYCLYWTSINNGGTWIVKEQDCQSFWPLTIDIWMPFRKC